eukprot:TRINITY_DN32917_c0_g1_i1.p1 TRINITY_DN32917_c0_g1~~TRINITY_DN32917_c0_g1_i1.p1  ORF type:complete len:495 (-),score=96.11 TRINITY_DN32917_c0_g1_i1:62-1546(-)
MAAPARFGRLASANSGERWQMFRRTRPLSWGWRYSGGEQKKVLSPGDWALHTRNRKAYEDPRIPGRQPTQETMAEAGPPARSFDWPEVPEIDQTLPRHANENPFLPDERHYGPFDCTRNVDHNLDPRIYKSPEPLEVGFQEGLDLPYRPWMGETDLPTFMPWRGRFAVMKEQTLRVPTVDPETVCVFGADTFLGLEVIRLLSEEEGIKEVRLGCWEPQALQQMIDRSDLPDKDKLKPFYAWQYDRMTIEPELIGADVAVNLFHQTYQAEMSHHQAHVVGTQHIAFGASYQDVPRLVHVSHVACNLINAVDSPSPYLRSLAWAEDNVRANYRSATVLRPGPMIGDFSSELRALLKVPLYLAHSPRTLIQPVWVTDVATAVVKCIKDNQTTGNTYELGGPDVWQHKDLAMWLPRQYGKRKLVVHGPMDSMLKYAANWYTSARSFFPSPVFTPDWVEIMQSTNLIVRADAGSFQELGVQPHRLEEVLNTKRPYGLIK